MSGNRIRRYDSLWTAPAEPGLGQPGLGNQGMGNAGLTPDGKTPTPSAMTTVLGLNPPSSVGGLGCSHAPLRQAQGGQGSLDVPPGFALFSLAHLTPAAQQAVYAQRALYQQAYDRARQSADEKFIRDWMI
jgi:hypothetical protein